MTSNTKQDYMGTDFYCDIALKDTEQLGVEYESDRVLAFRHTKPFWPVHVVVVPKKHISSFVTLADEDDDIFRELVSVLKAIASKVEREQGAARILTNMGEYQDSKHLHFHISSGEPLR